MYWFHCNSVCVCVCVCVCLFVCDVCVTVCDMCLGDVCVCTIHYDILGEEFLSSSE